MGENFGRRTCLIVVEGTREVDAVCAEAMAKLNHLSEFEDAVVWLPRTEEEPVGWKSERSRALVRAASRYEFDINLRKRVLQDQSTKLIIVNKLYDVGFWRRASEFGLKPDAVFYIEFVPPREDPKHSSFIRFMHSMGIRNITLLPKDDTTAYHIVQAALNLPHQPNVANV